MSLKQDLEILLKAHGQEHLIQFWDELSDGEQTKFAKELHEIDYDHLKELFDKALTESSEVTKKDDFMKPIPADRVGKKSKAKQETLQKWWDDGLYQISEGHVAVILLAGGQGTRLGVSYPKGMYNVGLPSGKTLYQIQAERIRKLEILAKEKYGKNCFIKWYIMNSEATLEETKAFFQQNSYFGLDEANILFFEQCLLPSFNLDGKLILESKGSLAKAPDGNGGLYLALHKHGILDEMQKHGIKHVHIYCVDNILVHPADPYFTGFVVERNADVANKVISKVDPKEAVGVTCICQEKIQVVEYSEITNKTAEKRAADGSLIFKDANICLHYFSLEFLQRFVRDHLNEMPHHVAKKKIPYIDNNGTLVKPNSPNGIKLEKFVFDVFQFSNNFVVYEVERNEEFSPLKNGPDSTDCSPISCKRDFYALNRNYLKVAGAKFVQPEGENRDESETVCEISPLVSFSGEGLEAYSDREFVIGSSVYVFDSPNTPSSPEQKKAKI